LGAALGFPFVVRRYYIHQWRNHYTNIVIIWYSPYTFTFKDQVFSIHVQAYIQYSMSLTIPTNILLQPPNRILRQAWGPLQVWTPTIPLEIARTRSNGWRPSRIHSIYIKKGSIYMNETQHIWWQ
jgi:hypothetical protein